MKDQYHQVLLDEKLLSWARSLLTCLKNQNAIKPQLRAANLIKSCNLFSNFPLQCWTEGRSSTALAINLRPTATVAEV